MSGDKIACMVRTLADGQTAMVNLVRRDLTPAQRATLIANRKAAYEAVHPETKKGGDRKPNRQNGAMDSFAKDTAAKSSKPLRTVERDITRDAS
jgi:ParB family chromosome partitioning protein